MAVLLGLIHLMISCIIIIVMVLSYYEVKYLPNAVTQVHLNVVITCWIWLNLVSSGYIRLNRTKSYVVRRRAH